MWRRESGREREEEEKKSVRCGEDEPEREKERGERKNDKIRVEAATVNFHI